MAAALEYFSIFLKADPAIEEQIMDAIEARWRGVSSIARANIIAMYPSTSLFIAVGQAAIVVLVLFSYPLQVHPCRNCLNKIFHAGEVKHVAVAADGDEGEDEDEEEVYADHAAGEMSPLKHTLLTAAIVISGFTIAYFVNDLQLVLSFVGSTGSTTISFILPGLFYWQLTRADRNRNNALSLGALALAAYGGCVFVFCLGFNIYNVFHPAAGGPAHFQ
ncbi:transmembrane amino acid transporter protein-domain-containing protein [Mycena galopus ATCC 62051]|nr:transmembrane amino acid transporter protein-domain-containing protein [Mycena galopus ATCC 62051]